MQDLVTSSSHFFVTTTVESEILRVLSEASGPLGPKQVTEAISGDYEYVRGLMAEMARNKVLEKPERGRYTVPGHESSGDGAPPRLAERLPAYQSSALPSVRPKTVRLVVHEVTAACGTKAEIVDALTDRDALVLEVARDVMAGFLGFLPPPTVRALHAKGRSMEPFVKDGQWVLYDPSDVAQSSGQRFVLQVHEHDTGDWKLYLKRVQWLTGGGVRLISDNPLDGVEDETFQPTKGSRGVLRHTVTGAEVSITVMGRVVWPSEGDDSPPVRYINRIIDRLAMRGFIKEGL